MRSTQGVVSDEHGVDTTGAYHEDSDNEPLWINANNDSLDYSWSKAINDFSNLEIK